MMCVLVRLFINQHMEFEVPSFTNSKDMIEAKCCHVTRFYGSRDNGDTDHAPLAIICHH